MSELDLIEVEDAVDEAADAVCLARGDSSDSAFMKARREVLRKLAELMVRSVLDEG